MRIYKNSKVPIVEQLAKQIKKQIISGKLKEGEQLPPPREIANNLKISGYTVVKAYRILVTEGLVTENDYVYTVKGGKMMETL